MYHSRIGLILDNSLLIILVIDTVLEESRVFCCLFVCLFTLILHLQFFEVIVQQNLDVFSTYAIIKPHLPVVDMVVFFGGARGFFVIFILKYRSSQIYSFFFFF